MLTVCSWIIWVNLILPAMFLITIPFNAWVDARYNRKFTKEYKSNFKAFLAICIFEFIIYIFGYASGLMLGVCL